MEAGRYVVFVNTSNQLCLGEKNGEARVVKYDPNSASSVWLVESLPGSAGIYLQHVSSSKCAKFGMAKSEPIELATLDPDDKEFVLYLDDVGEGRVAINNNDRSHVMDAAGDNPVDGAAVTCWTWNHGDNQRWRFVSTQVLTGGAR